MIDHINYVQSLETAVSKHNKLFESRPEPTDGDYIKTSIKFKKDDSEYVELLNNGFSHHDVSDFRYISKHSLDIHSTEDISRYFHHNGNYYIRPKIIQGQSQDNPQLSYDELLEKLSAQIGHDTQNQIYFLVGGVGIGKTTFICNFLSRQSNKLYDKKILPIKVNLDVSSDHQVATSPEILRSVKSNILSALSLVDNISTRDIERLTLDVRLPEESDENDINVVSFNFQYTLEQIAERYSFSPMLFLDNIDYLYHLGDRGVFAAKDKDYPEREEVEKAQKSIVDIVNLFWRHSEYGSSKLGMPVIISCRKDTISFLESKHREVPIPDLGSRIFSLIEPCIENAKEVIERRFDLIISLCDKINQPAKRKEFTKHTKELQRSYSERRGAGAALLEDLWKVSRKGLRDMINQISEYSWLEFLDEQKTVLNARFTQQYFPSMLAYMLAGRRRYTQFTGNIPNIYLLNAPSSNNELGVPSDFKKPHFYSLWLKRLILEYLSKREKFNTTELDIIQAFCGNNRRGYSEDLVRYVLSSLFEVPTAELINADITADGAAGKNGYIQQIKITERGLFVLNECANSFKYLQLMVDDCKLLFPKKLLPVFDYTEPDYSYLVAPEREYGIALSKLLQNKGNQAIYFAILIEETLKIERKLYPNVFKRLRTDGIGLYSPKIVTETLINEITSIHDAISSKANIDYLGSERIRQNRAVIKDKLEEAFAPCFSLQENFYAG